MRTIVVQGGWRAWALLVVGGGVLLVLGVTFGLFVLGLLVLVSVLVLGQRALQAIGLGGRRTPPKSARSAPGGPHSAGTVIEGEYQVVTRPERSHEIAEPRP